jgi:hypothetical protein
MLEHLGIRWGYTFLRTASHIPHEEMIDLMVQATEMYLNGEEERRVRGQNFEGKLYTERRYELLGQFGGQRFDAELETAYGRDQATFLVNEQTGDQASGFSRN